MWLVLWQILKENGVVKVAFTVIAGSKYCAFRSSGFSVILSLWQTLTGTILHAGALGHSPFQARGDTVGGRRVSPPSPIARESSDGGLTTEQRARIERNRIVRAGGWPSAS